jgi:hypothetical protein
MLGEGASVVEFKAGLERAIAEGPLELHRSGTYAIRRKAPTVCVMESR